MRRSRVINSNASEFSDENNGTHLKLKEKKKVFSSN